MTQTPLRIRLIAMGGTIAMRREDGRGSTPQDGADELAEGTPLLPADAWRQQMSTLDEHYGSNATLEPALEQQILDFLVRASAANRLPVEPSTTAGEPPRISQTRWFEHKHDEVSEAKFRREAVGGRANCVACHRDAERGDFDDDRVKIPR